MEQSLETFQALDPKEYLSKFTSSNTRPSSRPHHTARKTTLLPTILPRNTHGSSLVTIGSTQVITGITLQIGTPSPSKPKHGEVDVAVSFSPLCGGRYTKSGRIQFSEDDGGSSLSGISYSDPHSIESYVKRSIINPDLFDLSQLSVREGHSAWKVNIHCMVVNHDGNVVDACILGAMVALKDLRLPLVTVVSDKNSHKDIVQILPSVEHQKQSDVDVDDVVARSGDALELQKVAIPLTIALFQGKLLVDPTLEEEKVSDGMITVVIDLTSVTQEEGSGTLDGNILSLTKSGGGAMISAEEIAASVQLAFGRAQELKSIM